LLARERFPTKAIELSQAPAYEVFKTDLNRSQFFSRAGMSFGMSTLVRFGEFELDLEARNLSRAGQAVALNPRTYDLLVYFVQNAQRLVTREELLNALWPDSYVDESNLSQHVFLLRKALNESRETARIIRTVPGRGYEFAARVETQALEQAEAAAPQPRDFQVHAAHSITRVVLEEETEEETPARPRMRVLGYAAAGLAVVAAAAVAVAAIVAWRAAHAPALSIAVLSFANRTGDAGQDYVCRGLADEVIDQLDRFPVRQLRVIAPGAQDIDTGKPASQIGRALGAQYLLEGSLQQQGAYVRVSAQLVRVADQTTIWSSNYDGDLSDAFAFESSIADAVENALSLHLPALNKAAWQPEKFAARDAYLKGRYFFSQRSKAGFENAIENFSSAVAIDPKYAAAYAQLASVYNLMGQYSWMSPESARSLGWAAATQALSLDPGQSEAHAAEGFSLWFYRWDPPGAEEEFRRAIALDHANIDAHHWYALLLMTTGRFSEAEQQMQAALDTDPVSPILRTNLGWLRFYEGNIPQAVEQIQAVLGANPNFLNAHYKLWYIYSAMGDREHASEEFRWVVHSIADPARVRGFEDAYNSGGYEAALRACAADGDSSEYGSTVDSARCLMIAGNRDGALSMLERAYQNHEGWILFVPADPTFTALRGEGRFQALVAEIGKGR
jgi:DNA-binding winged helix-turn-helix (wHTH) protein/TolB-like protein/Tfp pilus assembly protein PilF